jgi:hypothetical protein
LKELRATITELEEELEEEKLKVQAMSDVNVRRHRLKAILKFFK